MTCQEVQRRELQLKEGLAQLDEAQARVAEALIRKGAVTVFVSREEAASIVKHHYVLQNFRRRWRRSWKRCRK